MGAVHALCIVHEPSSFHQAPHHPTPPPPHYSPSSQTIQFFPFPVLPLSRNVSAAPTRPMYQSLFPHYPFDLRVSDGKTSHRPARPACLSTAPLRPGSTLFTFRAVPSVLVPMAAACRAGAALVERPMKLVGPGQATYCLLGSLLARAPRLHEMKRTGKVAVTSRVDVILAETK